MTRLLAVADQHFGKGAQLAPTRLAEQEACWREVLRLARDEQVDAIVHAGDAFDRRRPTPEELLAFERPLVDDVNVDAWGREIIAINGNGSHDAEHGDTPSPLQVFDEAGLLHLHREPTVVKLVERTVCSAYVPGGIAIACLPWMSVKHLRARAGGDWDVDEINQRCVELLLEIAAGLRAQCDGPAVLVTHFAVDENSTPEGAPVHLFREPVLPARELAALGFDAVLAGHIHRPMIVEDLEAPVVSLGSPMPLDFGEGGYEHGVWIVEGSAAEFRPLDSPRFVTLTLDNVPDDLPLAGCYVRVKASSDDEEIARDLERDLIVEGAAYVRVEIETPRAQRARVEQLDETVSEADALAMWLTANEIDRDTGLALTGMDTAYREQVAA